MNIYNLPKEVETALAKYYACFDPETGELVVEDSILAKAQKELDEMENTGNEILGWKLQDRANAIARATMYSNEIERLSACMKREQKQASQADMLIERAFESIYDGKPMTIGTFTLSYRKSEATNIVDESLIPSQYLKTPEPPAPKPDKTAIKEAIKAGTLVPGAEIETRQNLQIK